jgi:hypothetical protein
MTVEWRAGDQELTDGIGTKDEVCWKLKGTILKVTIGKDYQSQI